MKVTWSFNDFTQFGILTVIRANRHGFRAGSLSGEGRVVFIMSRSFREIGGSTLLHAIQPDDGTENNKHQYRWNDCMIA